MPSTVERQEPEGAWTRRRCVAEWRREAFDVWRLTRFTIEGEPPRALDHVDGPTGRDPFWLCIR